MTEPTRPLSVRHGLELKIPPVAVVLLIGLAMWALARWMPSLAVVFPFGGLIALVLALVGIGVALAGVLAFRRARTTVNPTCPERSSSLVAVGVYRFSRNPMYLGLALALVGFSVWLSNPLSLLGPAGFVLWMNRFQIRPEERALAQHFGEDFRRYCLEVRRWI